MSHHLNRAGVLAVAMAALGLAAAGCSSGSAASTTTSSSASGASAASASSTADSPACDASATGGGVKIASGKPITVAIVPKLLGLPVFEANVKGAKQVASSLNVTVDYTASVKASGADQAQVIQGLVNSNNPPDVIAYSANDPTSIVPALQAAKAKGIKVIGFDSDVTASARSYFIQDTSYEAMGKALIDAVVAKNGKTGSVAILSSTKDATVQNAWIDAMKSYMSSTYPDLKLAGIAYGQSNQATSQSQATNLINSHPDLKALIPIDGAAVPGALAAVKSQGLVGKLSVFGIGDPNPNRQYFADGSLTGLFLWDEVKQGQLIAYVARGAADGTMPAAVGTFVAGDIGTCTVGNSPAANTIIFSKPLEFTKENYLKYDF
ncbi:putative ABC transporter, solute-binding, sugar transport [Nostocoides japonicum T1-X7]|uniref:Putative ABC transporter, solute-binding, sugar transport n=1 Tax=Nostocoides japonicum T1-X7 TaxID=1194083 RepID=A0A077M1F3_9MICO|nr:substrate-binding domain-containing protein [Tetrasphaera japonica]CCH78035.1 putative ABC transporter, solute-binding, sugar transport [Tetrasphaera japonica T1-X7]